MKTKAGKCYVCGKSVYVLNGKDVPSYFRGLTWRYCDFVGRTEPNAPKRHHECKPKVEGGVE